MEFDEKYRLYREIAEDEINSFFKDARFLFEGNGEFLRSYKRMYDFSVRGGKKVRPVLVMAGYEAVSCDLCDAIKKVSVYSENTHNFFLAHDDIMDQDDERRGGPTFHKWYESDFKGSHPELAEHLGISLGILEGDLLQALGIKPIIDADFPAEIKVRAMKEYFDTILNTGLGQKLDVLSVVNPNVDYKYVQQVHSLKTAQYTFARPLRVGAIFAGASEEQLEILSEYGLHTGIAFQLRDDLLGLRPKDLGKDKSDITEGKKTIIMLRALDQLDKEDKETLLGCLGSEEDVDLETALDLIKKTDAVDYNKRLYNKHMKKAREIIKDAPFNEEINKFLFDLAEYVTLRKK